MNILRYKRYWKKCKLHPRYVSQALRNSLSFLKQFKLPVFVYELPASEINLPIELVAHRNFKLEAYKNGYFILNNFSTILAFKFK